MNFTLIDVFAEPRPPRLSGGDIGEGMSDRAGDKPARKK
jgi:hypothetical protein